MSSILVRDIYRGYVQILRKIRENFYLLRTITNCILRKNSYMCDLGQTHKKKKNVIKIQQNSYLWSSKYAINSNSDLF